MKSHIPKISVIIPMYNAEKYISQCLQSLLNQSFQEFEVIVVDDCSTDNSLDVVKNIQPQFAGRLKISRSRINSGGAGIPRNIGIKLARGKYVAFLDNDDLFTDNALEDLYNAAENTQADVIHTEKFLYGEYDEKQNDNVYQLILKTEEFGRAVDKITVETKDLTERINLYLNRRFHWYVWNKLFRRDFLIDNKIEFTNLISSDDMIFCFECLCLSKNYVRIPNVINIYRSRKDSVSHRSDSTKQYIHQWLSTIIKGTEYLDKFMAKVEFFDKNPELKYYVIDFFIREHLYYFSNLYSQNSIEVIESLIRKEFQNSDNITLTVHLFNLVNIYRLKLIQTRN